MAVKCGFIKWTDKLCFERNSNLGFTVPETVTLQNKSCENMCLAK